MRKVISEEEYIDGLKPDGSYSEKIARQDLFFVVCYPMTPFNGAIANRHWLNSMWSRILRTVDWETLKLSLTSSPWILPYPQRGFS